MQDIVAYWLLGWQKESLNNSIGSLNACNDLLLSMCSVDEK